jgi:hypothetical protein
VDPTTAQPRSIPVPFDDARRLTVTDTRPRPAGYVLQPQATAAIHGLQAAGAKLCRVVRSRPLRAERFVVQPPSAPINRNAINPEQTVRVQVAETVLTPQAGAVWVTMDQPLGPLIASALEPDAPGSFVAVGLVPSDAEGVAPIYRVPGAARLPSACR